MHPCRLVPWLIPALSLFQAQITAAPSADRTSAILTPQPPAQPRINGPAVYGARPGNPFLYRIPCTGLRPIRFTAAGIPSGIRLDPDTGILTGTTPAAGEYKLAITAENAAGRAEKSLRILAGNKLALTPPMGWNSWYVHFNRVTDTHVRRAADSMIASGMADAGYQYVNIDDAWMNARATTKYMTDKSRVGPLRDEHGDIVPNAHFPDMAALTGYIHAKGLKAGIYTSPGATTCCGLTGSWQHEEQDAARFASWGFDFLKYDWCSYSKIAPRNTPLDELQKPYLLMGDALHRQKRDIVFNLCQYGMGDVWKWGSDVGGHCWRTAGDLGFELDRFFDVALKNAEHREWSKPGAWNDPDYIQIGSIGAQKGTTFEVSKPTLMTPEEQHSYMSLWCLMAAPLVFSGDMDKLDPFTLSVLCNPEVIEVNQDEFGQCARVVNGDRKQFIMIKNMADGSHAIGFFNRGDAPATMNAAWKDLGLSGPLQLRDLWRQKDLGTSNDRHAVEVPAKGCMLIRVRQH